MKKMQRVTMAALFVIFAICTIWYLFVPTGTGRIRLVQMLVRTRPSEIKRELIGTLRGLNYVIANFYVKNGRTPSPTEIREIRSDGQSVWESYGKNRYGEERYYHYGYDDGECTFVVEGIHRGAVVNECFERAYLDAFTAAHLELEHAWLLSGDDCGKELDYPELLLMEDFASISTCVQTLEELKWRRPELYHQIRNELQMEIEEGSYEKICVLSKPFQEKMAGRTKRRGASRDEPARLQRR